MTSDQSSESSFEIIASHSRSSTRTLSINKQNQDVISRKAMPASIRKYKAAAVQSEPAWFDLEKSVLKTIDLINEAGQKDCKLIAFPETCK
jgi:cyanide hydratase